MISKQMLIEKIVNEVRILKHLASKATTPELLNFRFSDHQRTTTQWLAYIALIGSAATKDMLMDDASGFETFTDRYEWFDPSTFATAIDQDSAEFIALLEAASDEKLAEVKTMWWSITDTRAGHVLSVYNLYVAYKTQIFLQLKAAGLKDLSTMNLWAGMDAPVATDNAA